MARRPAAPADRPVLILRPEIRLYEADGDLRIYFAGFPPRQIGSAIKRAVRAALSGGGLGLGSRPSISDSDDGNDDGNDLDDFIA